MNETLVTATDQEATKQTERENALSQDQSTCPECDGQILYDEEHGERTCGGCGLVLEDGEIDRGPEWRSFYEGEVDERSRVGAPVTELMHDKGLSTVIGWQDKDAYGNSISTRKREQLQRLRMWDERFRTKTRKSEI